MFSRLVAASIAAAFLPSVAAAQDAFQDDFQEESLEEDEEALEEDDEDEDEEDDDEEDDDEEDDDEEEDDEDEDEEDDDEEDDDEEDDDEEDDDELDEGALAGPAAVAPRVVELDEVAALEESLDESLDELDESLDELELSYGIALRSDYISDGESRSGGWPVLQGYVDLQRGLFFGNVWASTIDDDGDVLEMDFTLGIRPEFGDVAVELSYTRTFNVTSGDDGGEINLYAEQPLSDAIYVGGGVSFEPEDEETWLEIYNGVQFAEVWSFDTAIATDFGTQDGTGKEVTWNIGLTRDLSETAWASVRYYDSNEESESFIFSVGLDF